MNHILANLSNRGRISERNSAFSSASCTLPIGRHFEFHPNETWRHTGSCDWTNVYLRNTPSLLVQVKANLLDCFKLTYQNTCVILDCTEIKVQTPSSKVLNSEFYSPYKSHITYKGLVGISPNGSVTFVSSPFQGSVSDKEITRQSGIPNLLEEGAEVMADKGFLIEDLPSTVSRVFLTWANFLYFMLFCWVSCIVFQDSGQLDENRQRNQCLILRLQTVSLRKEQCYWSICA